MYEREEFWEEKEFSYVLHETYHPNVAFRVVLYKSEAEHIYRLNSEVAFGKSARRYKRVPRFPERIPR